MEDDEMGKINDFNDFSLEDAVNILLYSDYKRPIKGRLVFIKQMFLLSKEILKSIEEKIDFFPSHYGPYSKKLALKIDEMIVDKKINTESYFNEFGDEVYRFSLSPEGLKNAKNSFEKLNNENKELIMSYRRKWDDMGYTRIIRYVYSNYPEYTINSKIRDKIL